MKTRTRFIVLLSVAIFSAAFVYTLFSFSETIIHYKNNFTRRFPQHVAWEHGSFDLEYNSYYLAGVGDGKIYLGNVTTPSWVTVIDTALKGKTVFKISIDDRKKLSRSPQLRVSESRFYLYEGMKPTIYAGNVKDWKARLRIDKGRQFSLFEPLGPNDAAVRYFGSGYKENILGKADFSDHSQNNLAAGLLQTDNGGIIDTDGSLKFDPSSNRLVYTYLYRNEFIVMHADMRLDYRGNTIDTVSKAQIKLATLKDGSKKFARPPLTVNKTIAVANGLLFVNSALPGQYDSDVLWQTASIIDVYDLKDGAYRSSFPIYAIKGKKLDGFLIYGKNIYAIIEDKLVRYGLRGNLTADNKLETKHER